MRVPGGNQRDRSIEVERYAEIPREMVQGAERDDPERNPAVGQDAGEGANAAVPTADDDRLNS